MTIDEFAKAVGVSATTVSRTLSGRGRISAATREMIFERMRELDYTPNVMAQRLVTGRTQTILLDCGEPSESIDLFTFELVRAVQRALASRSYGLLLSSVNSSLLDSVRGGVVDGVILIGDDELLGSGPSQTSALAHRITDQNLPCVVIGHGVIESGDKIGSVTVDLQAGVRQAAQALCDLGHRDIAYIGSRPGDRVMQDFCLELNRLGISIPDSRLVVAGTTMEDGGRVMRSLLQSPQPPTAVFARIDTLAAGALRAARQLGVRVPEDLSVIGHDDMPFAAMLEPALSTVRVDCARVGEAAAEVLLQLLEGSESGAAPVRSIPTSLVMRETAMSPNPTEEK